MENISIEDGFDIHEIMGTFKWKKRTYKLSNYHFPLKIYT